MLMVMVKVKGCKFGELGVSNFRDTQDGVANLPTLHEDVIESVSSLLSVTKSLRSWCYLTPFSIACRFGVPECS